MITDAANSFADNKSKQEAHKKYSEWVEIYERFHTEFCAVAHVIERELSKHQGELKMKHKNLEIGMQVFSKHTTLGVTVTSIEHDSFSGVVTCSDNIYDFGAYCTDFGADNFKQIKENKNV